LSFTSKIWSEGFGRLEDLPAYETYEGHGVRFQYPGFWELSEERGEGEVTLTVNSGETSFWSLSLYQESPDPKELIETALETYEEIYNEIDIYPADAQLCQRETVARDIDFVYLELINGVRLRAFRTGAFTALLIYQGTDFELKETLPLLEGISKSLTCDGDDLIF